MAHQNAIGHFKDAHNVIQMKSDGKFVAKLHWNEKCDWQKRTRIYFRTFLNNENFQRKLEHEQCDVIEHSRQTYSLSFRWTNQLIIIYVIWSHPWLRFFKWFTILRELRAKIEENWERESNFQWIKSLIFIVNTMVCGTKSFIVSGWIQLDITHKSHTQYCTEYGTSVHANTEISFSPTKYSI